MHLLRDHLDGRVAARHLDQRRRVQQAVGERLDLVGEGRREQQVLPLLRQQREHPLDVVDEAHVEHAVGLVEDEDLDVREVDVRWPWWSSRRPGVATRMSTPRAQLVDLRLHADAAEHHHARRASSACRRCARFPRPARRARASASGSARGSAACRAASRTAGLAIRRCRIGSTKPAVLPVPVWAPASSRRRRARRGSPGPGSGWGWCSPVRARRAAAARPGRGNRKSWESSAKSSACRPRKRAPVEGRRGEGVGSDCVGADWKHGDASRHCKVESAPPARPVQGARDGVTPVRSATSYPRLSSMAVRNNVAGQSSPRRDS